MKNILSLILLLFAFTILGNDNIFGQDNREFNDRIKAKRIAFYTDQLQLTPAEAQKFWPLFNEYEQKKNALSVEKRKLTDHFTNSPGISEAEVDKIINQFVLIAKQETQLFEAYNKQFRGFLPAQKVMKLYIAETKFKVELLRELKANSK